jgi:aryl-alcohol dehydrogenase-like predicted oxidoreductase
MSRDMGYRHLGRSGLLVSPIGLGTMAFGYLSDEASSLAIVDAALDAGINLVDTADVYGGPQSPDLVQGYGISEEILGRWLSRTGRRDDIVLATKVYQPMGLGPNDRRLSAYHLRRACEASLRRLQTDHIDLYQMHHVDRATPWDEVWQAMEQLVQQGKVSYVGSSNFAGWDIATAQAVAGARHFVGLTSEQSLYNLAVRAIEQEVVPALRHLGVGLIAYSPLHAGLLTGAVATSDTDHDPRDERVERLRTQLHSYEALCAQLGATPTQVALAWVLSNPVTSAAIVGPTSIGQLDADLAALTTHLEPAVLQALDEIFPGPGEAPGSYAW